MLTFSLKRSLRSLKDKTVIIWIYNFRLYVNGVAVLDLGTAQMMTIKVKPFIWKFATLQHLQNNELTYLINNLLVH